MEEALYRIDSDNWWYCRSKWLLMTQCFLSDLEVTFDLSAVLRVAVVSLLPSCTLNRGKYLFEIKIILFK